MFTKPFHPGIVWRNRLTNQKSSDSAFHGTLTVSSLLSKLEKNGKVERSIAENLNKLGPPQQRHQKLAYRYLQTTVLKRLRDSIDS